MTNYLILAEKGELGRAIDSAIKQGRGQIPEGNYQVLSASGHLLGRKDPKNYDPKYDTPWRTDVLPICFWPWEEVPLTGKTEQSRDYYASLLTRIEQAIQTADVLVNAGDPDAEGQYLIDQLIYRFMKQPKPVLRLLVNDTSTGYIIKQLQHMEPNEKWISMGVAAQARTVADAVFGFNFSRWYICTYNNSALHVGRVQTPTLGLVVQRDRQIDAHQSVKYFELQMQADASTGKPPFPVKYTAGKNDPILTDGKVLQRDSLDQIAAQLEGQTKPGGVKRSITKQQSPLPFNLAKLQAYCASHFGLDPIKVQDEITQSLRAKSLITYNRSTSQYLHEDMHRDAPNVMNVIRANLGVDPKVDLSIKSQCFDDKACTEAHTAIIPTATKVDPSTLTEDELHVYRAIADRYIIQFMPPKQTEVTTVTIRLEAGAQLTARSSILLDPGFTAWSQEKDSQKDESTSLSDLPDGGYNFLLSSPEISEHDTKPPKRYTKTSLIEDMCSVAKYCTPPVRKQFEEKDKELKSENGSIGTPATRAPTVEKLLECGLIELFGNEKSQQIRSTPFGQAFYDMLPDDLKALDRTVKWWQITEEIRQRTTEPKKLIDDVLSEVNCFLASPPAVLSDPILHGNASGFIEIGKCPRCGKSIVEGKKGYGCIGYREKENPCSFVIWKSNKLLAANGKTVTLGMAKKLLTDGTCKIRDLRSKEGRRYDAFLDLEDTGEYVNLKLRFPTDEEDSLGKCPRCGRPVKENQYGYGCVSYKDTGHGCGFFLRKENVFLQKNGKTLTRGMVRSLLNTGVCEVRGLTSAQTGKLYNANLVMKDTGGFVNLELSFDNQKKKKRRR